MDKIRAFGGKFVTRAPRGGLDHPVNGKFYQGGRFCPPFAVSGGSPAADYSGLSDDQLVELVRGALEEALRRGPAVTAAARSATLDAQERARIAAEAAEREAARLKAAEAAKVAADAAARVRAEAQAAELAAEAAINAKVRALAVRARELFGCDVAEFTVKTWTKGADKRLYIGGGYDNNWVEYYHTGNARTAPGELKTFRGVAAALATHRGLSFAEAQAEIKEFCVSVCEGWAAINLEVNASNAPLDPATLVERFAVAGHLDPRDASTTLRYATGQGYDKTVKDAANAKLFETREAAEAAIDEMLPSLAYNDFMWRGGTKSEADLARSEEYKQAVRRDASVVATKVRLAFAPKVEVAR